MGQVVQAARGLCFLGRQYGIFLAPERIEEDLARTPQRMRDLPALFAARGLAVHSVSGTPDDLIRRRYLIPSLALRRDGSVAVLTGLRADPGDPPSVRLIDPASPGAVQTVALDAFARDWSGRLFLVGRQTGEAARDRPFGWRWFLPELARHRLVLMLVFLMSLLLNLLAFAPIVFVQIALDKVLGYKATSTLTVLTIGVALALAFNALLGTLRDRLIRHVSTTIEARITGDIFDKTLDLPLSTAADGRDPGLDQALGIGGMVRSFLGARLLPAVFDLTAILVFLPVLFAYSLWLGGLVLGFGILMAAVSLLFKAREKRLAVEAAAEGQERQAILRETMADLAAVKTLSQQDNQRRRWRSAAARTIVAGARRDAHAALAGQVTGALQQLLTVSLVFTGVWLVFAGQLSAGAIIAANMIAARVVRPLVSFTDLYSEVDKIRDHLEAVSRLWNAAPERLGQGNQKPLRGGLALSGLVVRFGSETKALDELSLTIPQGAQVAVVGPSGAGKTTLLRLMQGLIRPTEGSIQVDGTPLAAWDLEHYRRQVALLTARPTFYAGTIEQNLRRVRPTLGDRELDEALALTGFDAILAGLPQGLTTEIDSRCTALPATHRQLLALTRALVADPRVLLIDEAFADVDLPHLLTLRANMGRIAAGRTLVMVSHDLGLTTVFPRLVVMDKGRIVADGSHAAVLAACPAYATMWRQAQAYAAPFGGAVAVEGLAS